MALKCIMFQSIIFTLLSLAAAQEGPIKNCGETSDPFKLSSVSFRPYPLVAGKSVVITTNGTFTAQLNLGANITTVYKFGFFTVFEETKDFCVGAAAAGNPCPFPSGKRSVKYLQTVPANAPSGTFNVQVTLIGPKGGRHSCFSTKIKVVK